MKNAIARLEQNFEKEFRNFDDFGQGRYYGADGLTAQSVSVLPSLAVLYTITIANSNAANKNVTILNPRNGTPSFEAGVTVTLAQDEYSALLYEAGENPMRIQGMKMDALSVAQINQAWTLGYKNSRGENHSFSYSPAQNNNSYQNIATRVEDPNFSFTINSFSYLTIPVLGSVDSGQTAGEVVTLKFFISDIINPSLTLDNKPSIAINSVGYVSGLPGQSTKPAGDSLSRGTASDLRGMIGGVASL